MADRFATHRRKLPQAGDSVSLTLELSGRRFEVTWIGFLFDAGVVVSAPLQDEHLVPVFANDTVAVRYLKDNHIHGFKTGILAHGRSPYPHLHLEYPREIAEHRVRTAQRVATRLAGRISTESGEAEVVIRDLSDAGACLVAARDDLKEGDALELHLSVGFAGVEEDLVLPCVVKNCREAPQANGGDTGSGDARRASYGVAFGELDRMDRVMLSGYIYEQLTRQRASL